MLTFASLFPCFCLSCTNVLATLVFGYIITNDACTITFVYASLGKCPYWARRITDAKEAFMHLVTTGYQAKYSHKAMCGLHALQFCSLQQVFRVVDLEHIVLLESAPVHTSQVCIYVAHKFSCEACMREVPTRRALMPVAGRMVTSKSERPNQNYEGISFVYLPLCRGCSFSFFPPYLCN